MNRVVFRAVRLSCVDDILGKYRVGHDGQAQTGNNDNWNSWIGLWRRDP